MHPPSPHEVLKGRGTGSRWGGSYGPQGDVEEGGKDRATCQETNTKVGTQIKNNLKEDRDFHFSERKKREKRGE